MPDEPTSASSIEEPSSPEARAYIRERSEFNRPQPLGSLLASAQRLTSQRLDRTGSVAKSKPWQDDAWEMFNLVGEQRFLATTLAGRLSQARLFVGRVTEDPTEPPELVSDGLPAEVFDSLGKTSAVRAQLIARLGVNLFVAGDGWLVGIPRDLLPGNEEDGETYPTPTPLPVGRDLEGGLALEDLEWRMLSVSEVSASHNGEVTLRLGPGKEDSIVTTPDDIYLIRVWRPHPRLWWEADSPTRSSLPVLHELVGLTMHISAQVDSRLAGAGVFIVPQSAARAVKIAAKMDPDDDSDPFTDALMEAMLTPINDRSNASATVPLVVTVPDEATDKFRHISFSTPLDAEARNMRDEAIRRLALGQDAPPELLLGVGGMNHWGAWLVREDVVTTHIEPPLALICDALTTQYLWPILLDQGYSEEEAHSYVIWYDVDHMVMRPNRFQDATVLYDKGVISDDSLRDAGGFNEQDAPPEDNLDRATSHALAMVMANPSLFVNPGLPAVIKQLRTALEGTEAPAEEEPVPVPPEPGAADEEVPAPEAGPPQDGSPLSASVATLPERTLPATQRTIHLSHTGSHVPAVADEEGGDET